MPVIRPFKRPHAALLPLLIAVSLLPAICPGAAAAAGVPGTAGSHYIVLVDDSGDMHRHREAVALGLAEQLYGTQGAALPPLRPERDRLSLLFFTIHTDGPGNACQPVQRYSPMPSSMFAPEEVLRADLQSREAFATALGRALSRPCRWRGNLSPIASAPGLALPFLGGRLAPHELFARTFVLVATNKKFNTPASPAFELEDFRDLASDAQAGRKIRDIPEAEQQLRRASSRFHLESPEGWGRSFSAAGERAYVEVFEALPSAPPPESRLAFAKEIVLDRLARSSHEVVLVPQEPQRSRLRIESPSAPSVADGSGRLMPLALTWSFAGVAGSPWRVGDAVLPAAEQRLDLERCAAPCRREGDHLVVPLMDLAPPPGVPLSREAPAPEGRLRFKVSFQFATGGLYDAAFVESPTQEVRVAVAEPLSVTGATFFPSFRLTSGELARLWRPADGNGPDAGLRPPAARDRVLAGRDKLQLLILIVSVLVVAAAVGAVLLHLYRTAYRRPFRPRLEWTPAPELVLDFTRPSTGHVLAGSLRVVNSEPVPWFGAFLGNQEQPTRLARITVDPPQLAAVGLELAGGAGPALGLLAPRRAGEEEVEETSPAALCLAHQEAIGDGKQIPLFLAAGEIRDLAAEAGAGLGDFVTSIALAVRVEWTPLVPGEPGALAQSAAFALLVRPEAPRPPRIAFAAANPPDLFFRRGAQLEAGHFVFTSSAVHRFALPFTGEYLIAAARDGAPLAGQPFHLPAPLVVLRALSTRTVPVMLDCDGGTVGNPDPASQVYELRLVGPRAEGSEPGPHHVRLFRDPTRAELELEVSYLDGARDLFWTAEGPRQRLRAAGGLAAGPGAPLAGAELTLESPFELRFAEGQTPLDLLGLRIGNSGTAGRGAVEVELRPRLWLTADAAKQLGLRSGRRLEDLLLLRRRTEAAEQTLPAPARVMVREGDPPWHLDLLFDPGQIDSIALARIEPGACRAELDLEILVRDDQGAASHRRLTLRLPLALERLPGPNWLCIDFGTSAIAAAIGNGTYQGFRMIDLQQAPVNTDSKSPKTLDQLDKSNAEKGTPFLPSWVICNADLRAAEPAPGMDGWRPGFPSFQPASLHPGEASFLGLPALNQQLLGEQGPRRVIFSLKSWLGSGAREIRLAEKVRYLRKGEPVYDHRLPLDAVVESGFAALAETYLSQVKSEQIVLCHPNTFTVHHRERLHAAAVNALMGPLGVASPAHIRLLSESDAVAFSYCSRTMREAPRGGSERLLVYDFGAGTLDLSLVRIEWNPEPCYPKKWTVEGRLGVPVAGNHLDEVLARQVDELLRDPRVMRLPEIVYSRPVVAPSRPSQKELPGYREAVLKLAASIRTAKQAWDGHGPLEIRVGDMTSRMLIVDYDKQKAGTGESLLPAAPESGSTTLWREGDDIWLSIPSQQVRSHPRMEELMRFVTETVVDEVLGAAGLTPSDVDTLIVSGRGALWPVLRRRLLARFPRAEKPSWLESGTSMKEAVVRGAMAWQDLIWQPIDDRAASRGARLGVLLGDGTEIVMEEDWGPERPIDLTASPSFRLVQVGLRHPDPRRDLNSLRRHFYVDLSPHLYLRDTLWRDDPRLFAEKTPQGYVLLRNGRGQTMNSGKPGSVSVSMTPPWPVGRLVLEPLEGEG
jgi:hypothetical protein